MTMDWRYHSRIKTYFLGKDLVSVLHKNTSQGIVTIRNWTQDTEFVMGWKDFVTYRRKAYTIKESAALLNKHPVYFAQKSKEGWWPEPLRRTPTDNRAGFYSEEMLYQARELMSQVHWGGRRKDGRVTNNRTPSESELRAKINNQFFVYVKDADGNYTPTLNTFDR